MNNLRSGLVIVALIGLSSCTEPAQRFLATVPVPSAGSLTTCLLAVDQSLLCWGANTGAGAEATTFVPAKPTMLESVKEFAQSASTPVVCAIVDAGSPGSVWCWVGTAAPAPIKNSNGTPLTGMRGIAVGGPGACAIRSSDATLLCWRYPQVPGTSALWQATPSSVANLAGGVTQVTIGGEFACALQTSGVTQVFCWGEDGRGQLGRGVATPGEQRAAAIPNLNAVRISAGVSHTCALLAGGSIRCWGTNVFGQLGNGSTAANVPTPTAVTGISNATAVSAGFDFSCAVLADQTARCWGSNDLGKLGIGLRITSATWNPSSISLGSPAIATSPIPVRGISTALSISAGTSHACVGGLGLLQRCWGNNSKGELLVATTTMCGAGIPCSLEPVP